MTLADFESRGFKLVAESRRTPDERGIDGAIILRKLNRKGPQHQSTIYAAAHYAVGNRYGEPVPVPPQVVMGGEV